MFRSPEAVVRERPEDRPRLPVAATGLVGFCYNSAPEPGPETSPAAYRVELCSETKDLRVP